MADSRFFRSAIAFTNLFAAVSTSAPAPLWLGTPFFVASATAGLGLSLAAWSTRRRA